MFVTYQWHQRVYSHVNMVSRTLGYCIDLSNVCAFILTTVVYVDFWGRFLSVSCVSIANSVFLLTASLQLHGHVLRSDRTTYVRYGPLD